VRTENEREALGSEPLLIAGGAVVLPHGHADVGAQVVLLIRVGALLWHRKACEAHIFKTEKKWACERNLLEASEGRLPGEFGALIAVGARDLLRGLDTLVAVVD
jgi:hypothetical protein